MNRIKALVATEPILTRMTPVLGLLAIYLIGKYVTDADLANLLLGVATIVLGGGAMVTARSAVRPLAKDDGGKHRKVIE
ncbi:hypothetical protein [Nocardia farcinica]|uniref:hypothetical protein n=1 Tax=Nocardia farcinica TaxID=37329 RepID=UPI001894FE6D|nr:hypothetical protein [Nocardia farcinica]MBF6411192.1 hypothetical protein [Nocardia farcinica]